ncbi:hypothetical protein C1H46_045795 [Malus baccata]|uniref:Uncharacterized protein n=1 Tax=Malus baccata TaxID=106549 RepID=A0A540K473_MALBA|nr:hypothetical protein C1H46_045795 [Malus baccata]
MIIMIIIKKERKKPTAESNWAAKPKVEESTLFELRRKRPRWRQQMVKILMGLLGLATAIAGDKRVLQQLHRRQSLRRLSLQATSNEMPELSGSTVRRFRRMRHTNSPH